MMMKSVQLAILSLMAFYIIIPIDADAQRVDAYLSQDTVSVGDRFTLTVVALHGFDQIPSFPSPDSAFGDIIPIELLSAGSQRIDSVNRIDSAIYEVTTFALDTARLSPLFIGFDNASVIASTNSQLIYVTSLVPQDAEGIRDMAPPVDFGPPIWPYVLLGIAAVIIGLLIWYFVRKKRQPDTQSEIEPESDISPPPSEVALARLHALETTPLTTRPQIEAYYVELSDAVRTYIEHRLGIPALESTTQELVLDLIHPSIQHKIPSGVPQIVDQILSLSDLVKFADFTPTIPEGRNAIEDAMNVIRRVEVKFDQREASEKLTPTD